MATIKNNFELIVEEIQAQHQNGIAGDIPVFDGVDLNAVFKEIEDSLERYRFEAEKKHNDSRMQLSQIFLSV